MILIFDLKISWVIIMVKIREPYVAGQFYPADPDELKKMIEWSFVSKFGPGTLPSDIPAPKRTIIAAQVPHAGYIYSGPAAAHVYYSLYNDGKPDSIIIIGPNHTGFGAPVSVYAKGAWKTPLGIVNIDEDLAKELISHEPFTEDYFAHETEHSIEVQLPFLQYIWGSDFKFVPITLMDQTLPTIKKIADILLKIINRDRKDILILASSDMSHYHPYNEAINIDKMGLNAIENYDIDGLYDLVLNKGLSMCGFGGVAIAMIIAKSLGATPFTLKYYTSGDISGDRGWVVGYAAVIFSRGLIIKKEEAEAIKEAYPAAGT